MKRNIRVAAATAISVLAIVLPHQLPAQSLMPRPQAPEPDITAYLPPVTSVPWLDQKAPVKDRAPKLDAGSLTAWLWMPSTRPAWPTHQARASGEAEPFWM
jgi:hypothetical protein